MCLSWGLAIATRDRPEMLCRCVEAALRQSRPPCEIVICDSSEGWDQTRTRIENLVSEIAPEVRLWYGPSVRGQQTVQRNISIHHSSADVLFMIDDDAILRRDAAERVMKLYENRVFGERIAAVGIGAMKHEAGLTSTDDDAEMFRHDETVMRRAAMKVFGLFFFAGAMSRRDRLNLDPTTHIKDTTFIEGYQITVRRTVAARCGFDETLVSNMFEDLDASVRFAQKGAVVMLERPLIYHARAQRGTSDHRRGVMQRFGWIVNIAYLNRKYFGDGLYTRLFCWTHWLRCIVLDVVLAVARRDASRVKACCLAVPVLWRMTWASKSRLRPIVVQRTEALKFRLHVPTLHPILDENWQEAA